MSFYNTKYVYGLSNVIILRKALWSYSGKLRLFKTVTATGHTLIADKEKILSGEIIDVETDTLDNIICHLRLTKIDYLIMNIEGAELEALKGASKALKITKYIRVVCHSKGLLNIINNILRKERFATHIVNNVVTGTKDDEYISSK